MPDIDRLIKTLGNQDGLIRLPARHELVDMGKSATPALVGALEDTNRHRRWEAAKALTEIQDPAAAPDLVRALQDEEFGVRWLAAEALVGLGREGLAPLLQALMHEPPDSAWLRQGAHHVLCELAEKGLRGIVSPVLQALDGVAPTVTVPVAAKTALDRLVDQ